VIAAARDRRAESPLPRGITAPPCDRTTDATTAEVDHDHDREIGTITDITRSDTDRDRGVANVAEAEAPRDIAAAIDTRRSILSNRSTFT
jgi:hypothetical protein